MYTFGQKWLENAYSAYDSGCYGCLLIKHVDADCSVKVANHREYKFCLVLYCLS